MVCHSLLQWTTVCQTSPPYPPVLGGPTGSTLQGLLYLCGSCGHEKEGEVPVERGKGGPLGKDLAGFQEQVTDWSSPTRSALGSLLPLHQEGPCCKNVLQTDPRLSASSWLVCLYPVYVLGAITDVSCSSHVVDLKLYQNSSHSPAPSLRAHRLWLL